MNYEEMLEKRDGVAMHHEEMPLGTFYKKLIDKKYRNVVGLRPDLSDSMLFCDGLRKDAEFTDGFHYNNQLHFSILSDSNGIYELELEKGNYTSFMQVLGSNPALVARGGYIEEVFAQLAKLLDQLHERNVFACCLAPQTIFARKSDNMPLLLLHGSFFKDKKTLFKGFEEFVAPEVLDDAEPDERSDVYALGKFIQWALKDVGIPYEYKKALDKATSADPLERQSTPDDLLNAIKRRSSLKRTVLVFAATLVVALVLAGIYFEAVPEPVDVEFVNPTGTHDEDPFDDAELIDEELSGGSNDTTVMTDEERQEMAALQAKNEEIFKRQFTREAERVLSKIYSADNMNSSQQAFIATSNTLMDDLMKRRDELAGKSGLPADKANHIASQIIGSIRDQKQKQLKTYGAQQPQE